MNFIIKNVLKNCKITHLKYQKLVEKQCFGYKFLNVFYAKKIKLMEILTFFDSARRLKNIIESVSFVLKWVQEKVLNGKCFLKNATS